ncbi:hypothetical protein KSS87_012847 [Heliosperma pusillum]|nr:hypothetical protein KSS87_012847 [Heliosperma pusillum]
MENPTSQITDWDWEEVVLPPSSLSSASSAAFHGGPHGDAIRSHHFSPNYDEEAENETEDEGKGSESDNPSWVDPTDIPAVCAAVDGGGSSSSDEDSGGRSLFEPHSECCGCGLGLGFGEIGGNDGDRVEELGFCEEEEKDEREEEKKVVVWWKVPIDVIKYCVFRVSPVWSLSMAAAALMGFVILRRRFLYKLKRKTLGIQLNVAVDDKKVSQFMSRAARLNEAFSVVKRVPIIRPALPAPGMAPWPVMSLR